MKPVTLSLVGLGAVVGMGAFGMERYVGLLLLGWLIGMLGGVPTALVLQAVFPRFLRRTSECLERGPWSSLMVGVLGVLIAWLASHVAGQAHGLGKFLGSIASIGLAVVTVFGAAAAYRLLGSRMYFSMNSPRTDVARRRGVEHGGAAAVSRRDGVCAGVDDGAWRRLDRVAEQTAEAAGGQSSSAQTVLR